MSTNNSKKSRTIRVDTLARVEGEGALYVRIRNNAVAEARLKIYEPPRFFEAFLRGRSYQELPDITARICGICPVAYQMSAVHATEAAFAVHVGGMLRELRRLLYCAEWIESHYLHIYMLHAPDFLGYDDAIAMAADHPAVVQRGLRLKKIGNDLMTLIGGREIHPINVRAGGFYRVPTKKELRAAVDDLQWGRDAAVETVRWVAALPFPEFDADYEFVALRHPEEYPFNEGRLVSNKGLDIAIEEYDRHFIEQHVEHSNALHSQLIGGGEYMVGPLARCALNFDHLTPLCRELAAEIGFTAGCANPFRSIIARAIEGLYAYEEALRIIDGYEPPDVAAVEMQPQAATGYGCTEAPRGMLLHRYSFDAHGRVLDAKIVPPTSQNQRRIESDLREFITAHLHLTDQDLTWKCEQAIRNYDPCISCATHFLKLEIERE